MISSLKALQENIVVQESDKGYSTLIIDFGLAIVGDDLGRECDPGPSTAEKWRDFRRRPVARATEVQKPDSASDVWAFGLLCCWVGDLLAFMRRARYSYQT
jgi:hypothetical protein